MTNQNLGGSGRGRNPEDRNERPGEGAGRGNQAANEEIKGLREKARDGSITPEEQARLDQLTTERAARGEPDDAAAEVDAAEVDG